MKNPTCTIPTTMSPNSAIARSNPTMIIVANPKICNIRVLLPSSVGKVTSSHVKTPDYIGLFMTHNKHHQMTCSENDVYVKKST